MDGLRPRKRQRLVFTGFTKAEIEKMENLLKEADQPMDKEYSQRLARGFNNSAGRAGKPIVRWTEVQNWFQNKQQDCPSKVASSPLASKSHSLPQEASPSSEAREHSQTSKGDEVCDISELEFEARSSKDGAWYDVDMFLCHRFLTSGEAEVRVRFAGFGAEEDEWVSVKEAIRERSVPLDNSECHKVKVGDHVCCFQERRDQAIYYDAHVLDIQRKVHDVRGCRCIFTIRYDHDGAEEKIRLRRLCYRPTF